MISNVEMERECFFLEKKACLSALALEFERNTNIEMEIERCFFGKKFKFNLRFENALIV